MYDGNTLTLRRKEEGPSHQTAAPCIKDEVCSAMVCVVVSARILSTQFYVPLLEFVEIDTLGDDFTDRYTKSWAKQEE